MEHCAREDEPREEQDLNCEANRDDVGASGLVFCCLARYNNGANALDNERHHVSSDEDSREPADSHNSMPIRLDDCDDPTQGHVYTGSEQRGRKQYKYQSSDVWSESISWLLFDGRRADDIAEEFDCVN